MTDRWAEWVEKYVQDRRVMIAGVAVFAAVVLAAAALMLPGRSPKEPQDPQMRLVARVTVDGTQILAIDLYQGGLIECSAASLEGKVEKKSRDLYFDLHSVGVPAVLRVKNDRQICVDYSDCKDQACVKRGYIGQLEQAIECAEDGLRVEIIEKTVL